MYDLDTLQHNVNLLNNPEKIECTQSVLVKVTIALTMHHDQGYL